MSSDSVREREREREILGLLEMGHAMVDTAQMMLLTGCSE